MLKNRHIMEERSYILRRYVLIEKNPFFVYTKDTYIKLLVKQFSKEGYIILNEESRGIVIEKSYCTRNEPT